MKLIKKILKYLLLFSILLNLRVIGASQNEAEVVPLIDRLALKDFKYTLAGKIKLEGRVLKFAGVAIKELNMAVLSDEKGYFQIKPVPANDYTLVITHPRIVTQTLHIGLRRNFEINLDIAEKFIKHQSSKIKRQNFASNAQYHFDENWLSKSGTVNGMGHDTIRAVPSLKMQGTLNQKFNIRGYPEEFTQVFVENIPVKMLTHGYGLYQTIPWANMKSATFNLGQTKSAKFLVTGLNEIDVSLKTSSPNKFKMSYEMNPYGYTLETNYRVNEQFSGSAVMRRSIWEMILPLTSTTTNPKRLNTADYWLKNKYVIDDHQKIEWAFIGMYDRINLVPTYAINQLKYFNGQSVSYKRKIKNTLLDISFINNQSNEQFTVATFANSFRETMTAITASYAIQLSSQERIALSSGLWFAGKAASLNTKSISTTYSDQNIAYDSGMKFNTFIGAQWKKIFQDKVFLDFSSKIIYGGMTESISYNFNLSAEYVFNSKLKFYSNLINGMTEPERFKILGLPKDLKNANMLGLQTGLKYDLDKYFSVSSGIFTDRIVNIANYSPLVGTSSNNSYLFKYDGKINSIGSETSLLLKWDHILARISYTLNQRDTKGNLSYLLVKNILNFSLVYFDDNVQTTLSNNFYDNEVFQSIKVASRSKSGASFYFEVGWYLSSASIKKASSFVDVDNFITSTFSQYVGIENSIIRIPLHLSIGFKNVY